MSAKSRDEWRRKNPMKYTYNNLKSNAKRRGKVFTLTFEEFKEFAIEYDYMNNKGRSATGLHVDRVIETEGYTKKNLQALPNTDNIRKFIAFKYRDREGAHFHTVTQKLPGPVNYPF